ncbi:MAG: hypothetical protein HN406_16450, partial [Lentisphaerae bacterium]|nr:hypothetical protein [Lentisphaerota bacterium]
MHKIINAVTPILGLATACIGMATEAADDDRLVMLGNSMQGCGIDFPRLSKAIGHRVKSQVSGGVMSAHKFAMLWNVAHGTNKPKVVIVVFRLGNITHPKIRVTGKYGAKLKAILKDPELERIVNELAYSDKGDSPRGQCRQLKRAECHGTC